MSQSPLLLTALELESLSPSLSYHLVMCTGHKPLKFLFCHLRMSTWSSVCALRRALDHT